MRRRRNVNYSASITRCTLLRLNTHLIIDRFLVLHAALRNNLWVRTIEFWNPVLLMFEQFYLSHHHYLLHWGMTILLRITVVLWYGDAIQVMVMVQFLVVIMIVYFLFQTSLHTCRNIWLHILVVQDLHLSRQTICQCDKILI